MTNEKTKCDCGDYSKKDRTSCNDCNCHPFHQEQPTPESLEGEWEKRITEMWETNRGTSEDVFTLKEFIDEIRQLLNKRELPPAIGVSQWMNYGEKYHYADFWRKEIKKEIIEKIENKIKYLADTDDIKIIHFATLPREVRIAVRELLTVLNELK